MYTYKATVIRWIDGDHLEATINLGFNIHLTWQVYLYGVNVVSDMAHKYCTSMAPVGSHVILKMKTPYQATVETPDGTDIGLALVRLGFGTTSKDT